MVFLSPTNIVTALKLTVLGHCWLSNSKVIRLVKSWSLLTVSISPEICTFYSSSCHHSPSPSSLAPTRSRTETFWYRLTQVHLTNGCLSMLASSLKLPPSPLKLLILVILHILPACSTSTPHTEPYNPPQLICCQSHDVTCHLVLVVSVQLLLPSEISLPANVRSSATLSTFRRHLKSHLFQSSFPTA